MMSSSLRFAVVMLSIPYPLHCYKTVPSWFKCHYKVMLKTLHLVYLLLFSRYDYPNLSASRISGQSGHQVFPSDDHNQIVPPHMHVLLTLMTKPDQDAHISG